MVTPEGVVLDLPTATLGTRVPARALDLVVEIAGAGAILVGLAATGAGQVAALVAVSLVVFGALLVYPTVMEAFAGGRTLGKMAVGLRVISTTGAPIGLRQAAIRAVLAPVDLLLGAVCMLVSPRGQRLGDLAAGTVVVRSRSGGGAVAGMWFAPPPGMESFTTGLDTAGMGEAEYEVVRSYLRRWSELRPEARWVVGAQIARGLVAKLGHALPQWMAPDLYLACLAAAYQARRPPLAPAP